MKILVIEATAEELRANRTVMDTITDVLSNFASTLCGVQLSEEDVARAVANNLGDVEDPDNDV